MHLLARKMSLSCTSFNLHVIATAARIPIICQSIINFACCKMYSKSVITLILKTMAKIQNCVFTTKQISITSLVNWAICTPRSHWPGSILSSLLHHVCQRLHSLFMHIILSLHFVFLLFLLIVIRVVAVREPIQEVHRLLVSDGFGQLIHPSLTDDIGVVFLPISSRQFLLGSVTNHFTLFLPQLGLQILPVVAVLLMVILLVDSPHDVQHREPPIS